MKNLLYLLIAVILAGIIYLLSTAKETTTLSSIALTDFAIVDTSAIGRVYIADRHGNVADLTRQENGRWRINDEHDAMQYSVNTLLRTFKHAFIQQPVPKSERETVMKIIAGDNRKVKIYDREGDWIKTWYVGRATKTNQGTYALLETPTDGLSSEPIVLDMKGFRGYLTTRFHTKISEWRATEVFNYPDFNIREISVSRPRLIGKSYRIVINDLLNGDLKLYDDFGKQLPADPERLRQYAMKYAKVNLEHFEPIMTESEKDSLVNVAPDFKITVTDTQDESVTIDIYYRKITEEVRARLGAEPSDPDPDRYNMFFKGEWVSGQEYVFGDLLLDRSYFIRKAVGPLR